MRLHQFIDKLYAEYLRNQIGGGCPDRAKRALQEVCSLYSRGQHFEPLVCASIEVATVGQLEAHAYDFKVRRWCLNVLALIGTPERSKEAISRVIERHHNDPDTMASALTAYFKVEQNAYSEMRSKSFLSAQQIALAAYIGNFGKRLRKDETTINIEVESPAILRSSLVAVGLRRAPENLFHPKFVNSELVRNLSQHDDIEVAQYAVWAINEHPDLGVQELGIPIEEIASFPANIRGWTYHLFGSADIDDGLRHEVIDEGSIDPDGEARLNLARGIRTTFYDGLETITCRWFYDEPKADVREEILDHMVHRSDDCTSYREISLEAFENAPCHSPQAQRMLASARGKPIYAEMKKLEFQGDGDLFGFDYPNRTGVTQVTNNNINIGSIQAGAVSMSGDASITGDAKNNLTGDQTTQLKSDLHTFANELRALPNQTDELKDITALVDAAAVDPQPDKLAKVKGVIDGFLAGTGKLAKFGGDATKVVAAGQKLLPLLGLL